ncbi:MAG: hypothetical protein AAGG48_31000 [Planctomycetota bacterium]
MKIALAAEAKYVNRLWFDDRKLLAELKNRGHHVQVIDWQDKEQRVDHFDSIFICTTWNGCHHPRDYIRFLNKCNAGKPRLINDREVLGIGFSKSFYWPLLEQLLERNEHDGTNPSGVDGTLTKSHFFVDGEPITAGGCEESLDGRSLCDILEELEWDTRRIVLKPAISASGFNTFVYVPEGAKPIDATQVRPGKEAFVLRCKNDARRTFVKLARNTINNGVVLQPYVDAVESEDCAEHSMVVIGGKCVHAVKKMPLFGGCRTKDRTFIPTRDEDRKRIPVNDNNNEKVKEMREFAEYLVQQLANEFGKNSVSRARADIFYHEGRPTLCELECVDPNTNLEVVLTGNLEAGGGDSREVVAFRKQALREIVEEYARVIEERTATLAQASG